MGSCCLGGLIQGLQNLELPERETDWYFLRRAKSTAKTRRGLRPSGLPGTIQSSAGNNLGKAPDGTSRNRFFAQDGGEKALNRCEVPALQRKELERRLKEQPYSFADSRLWLGGNLWCWEWKRVAFEDSQGKACVEKEWRLACGNKWLSSVVKNSFLQMENVFVSEKVSVFSLCKANR